MAQWCDGTRLPAILVAFKSRSVDAICRLSLLLVSALLQEVSPVSPVLIIQPNPNFVPVRPVLVIGNSIFVTFSAVFYAMQT